jgi:hypothetical protein
VVLALRFFSPLLKTGLKLPDISELNGTAIDSVAEFDGLTVTAAAPAVPSPAAAYSVRLLDSAVGVSSYTGAAMRVRRVTGTGNTGNDDEADVAFDTSLTEPTISLDSAVSNFSAGGSNATTLGQFLNVGTVGGTTYTDADSLAPNTAAAYVDEWKDQSGNANHATQGTPSNQPQIHSGTVSRWQRWQRVFEQDITGKLRNHFFCACKRYRWIFGVLPLYHWRKFRVLQRRNFPSER